MDWFKVILVIAIILQEMQIISLRHEVTTISDMFFSLVADKLKNIQVEIVKSDDDE